MAVNDIRSLQLYELISAPLVAMIRADAEAAKATVDFIESVGFVSDDKAGTESSASRLRMAEFRYKKLDENNEVAEFVASVPLLSLVPIPAFQIKQAKVTLSAQITEVVAQKSRASLSPAAGTSVAVLRPTDLKVLTKPVATSTSNGQETKGNYHLQMEIQMGQADLPIGMEKLFNMMDQAVRDTKTDKVE